MASERENWVCSTCGHHSTLHSSDGSHKSLDLWAGTSVEDDQEGFSLYARLIRCPNSHCRQHHLTVSAYHGMIATNAHRMPHGVDVDVERPAGIGKFSFLPTTTAPLSLDVPEAVQADYMEAHLIRQLSPKASATLARRALQGMIRDYWRVSKARLADELKAIEAECDPEVYQAMMAVKSVGNIGAHPERDISTIVDIEPGEAQQLLDLIHLLDHEWYVARSQRRARLARMTALGETKAAERRQSGTVQVGAADNG